jgi:hypothetical protein
LSSNTGSYATEDAVAIGPLETAAVGNFIVGQLCIHATIVDDTAAFRYWVSPSTHPDTHWRFPG